MSASTYLEIIGEGREVPCGRSPCELNRNLDQNREKGIPGIYSYCTWYLVAKRGRETVEKKTRSNGGPDDVERSKDPNRFFFFYPAEDCLE